MLSVSVKSIASVFVVQPRNMKSQDERDHRILQRWNEFRERYVDLGFRRASYEYFALWLREVETDLPQMEAERLQSLLHAYRKRLRTRRHGH